MTFIPLTKRVVIKPSPKKEQTEGGIFLPSTLSTEPLIEGDVISTGADVPNHHDFGVEAGDHVLYSATAGGSVSIEGEERTILFFDDIWGIF